MNRHENPLLKGVPEFKDVRDLRAQLHYSPLDDVDTDSLDFMGRHEILLSGDMPYAPLSSSLRIALTLVGLMSASYKLRNPLNVDNRRDLVNMQVCAERGNPISATLGIYSAYVIKGITGLGKTALFSRLRILFRECIVHPKNEEAGWVQQIQIPILTIAMPGEGSRGGFIQAILSEIDRITGQEYSINYHKKYKSLDRLGVQIPLLLHRYQVGLLVVEEIQFRNLVKSSQSEPMQLLLLSIMNTGIPLVLVGNPLGFDWINEFSQDRRRLNHCPPEFLHPMDVQSEEFDEDWGCFFESVYEYYVLEGRPEGEKARLSHVLRSLSGGIPDLAMSLWKGAQKMVLFEEVAERCVCEETLKAAYSSEGFDAMRTIADGFTYRDSIQFFGCNDIPIDYYKNKWGLKCKPHDAGINEDNSCLQIFGKSDSTSKAKRVCTEKSKLQRAKTREANKQSKRKKMENTLSKEDLRIQGVMEGHLDGFHGLLRKDPEEN